MSEQNLFAELSNSLKATVKSVRPYVVNVLDGTRLTASGIIWDEQGHVIATSHGVERDEDLKVELEDGTTLDAEVLGRDGESDIAVLKIGKTSLPALPHADLSDSGPGTLVLAMGRPGHAGLQVTMGVISSLRDNHRVITTDAKLYPGFSGGALVDAESRLVGMLNLSFGRGRGIAVSTLLISEVASSIITQGQVRRGYLGVSTQPVALGPSAREAAGSEVGLLVTSVAENSPAESAGLLLGDVLLTLDETDLGDFHDLRRTLGGRRAGESVRLKLLRAGIVVQVTAELGARE